MHERAASSVLIRTLLRNDFRDPSLPMRISRLIVTRDVQDTANRPLHRAESKSTSRRWLSIKFATSRAFTASISRSIPPPGVIHLSARRGQVKSYRRARNARRLPTEKNRGRERRVERRKAPLVFATHEEMGKKGEKERERECAVSRSTNKVLIRVRARLFFLTAMRYRDRLMLRPQNLGPFVKADPPLCNLP